MRRSLPRRIRHWIANRGLRGFLAELIRRIRARSLSPHPGIEPERRRHERHPFDLRHGVDTSGLLWGERLDLPSDAGYWATGYYGVAPSTFRVILEQIEEQLHLDWPRLTFLDIGCGKGRALMLATGFPFRRIIGVELAPALAAIARENLTLFHPEWRLPVPTEVFTSDATVFPLPTEAALLYLYHPFAAPVMKRFLAHLNGSLRSHPRELYLLYVNPELDALILTSTPLVRLVELHRPLTDEDRAADLFASEHEHAIVYGLPPGHLSTPGHAVN